MTEFKMLGYVSMYERLQRYRSIKDIPKCDRIFNPVLISFGLWGKWFVPRGQSGLKTKEGGEMPYHQMYGVDCNLIGQRDLCAADGSKHQEAWRESLDARIHEEIGIK